MAATGDSGSSYKMRYRYENIWFTQKMMAVFYAASFTAISQHIKHIYEDEELKYAVQFRKCDALS